VALEKIDGVTAAYVNKSIEIYYAKGSSFDKDEVTKLLKPLKMVVKEAKKLDKLPF